MRDVFASLMPWCGDELTVGQDDENHAYACRGKSAEFTARDLDWVDTSALSRFHLLAESRLIMVAVQG